MPIRTTCTPLLEAELRERFQVRVERFAHGEFAVDMLLPRAADELIDEAEFDVDERLPYWAELWPSARALTRHLLDAPVPDTRVLELGCGVALPSLALLSRGAEVLATDYYEDALLFAQANADRHGLPPLPTTLVDWRKPLDLGRFDLILAADVLYEQRNAAILAALLPTLLSTQGRALLADPGRVYLTEFRNRMWDAGWGSRRLEVREEVSDPTTEAVSRVQILELRRAEERNGPGAGAGSRA